MNLFEKKRRQKSWHANPSISEEKPERPARSKKTYLILSSGVRNARLKNKMKVFAPLFSKSGFLLIHPQAVAFAPWRLDAQAYIRASNQRR